MTSDRHDQDLNDLIRSSRRRGLFGRVRRFTTKRAEGASTTAAAEERALRESLTELRAELVHGVSTDDAAAAGARLARLARTLGPAAEADGALKPALSWRVRLSNLAAATTVKVTLTTVATAAATTGLAATGALPEPVANVVQAATRPVTNLFAADEPEPVATEEADTTDAAPTLAAPAPTAATETGLAPDDDCDPQPSPRQLGVDDDAPSSRTTTGASAAERNRNLGVDASATPTRATTQAIGDRCDSTGQRGAGAATADRRPAPDARPTATTGQGNGDVGLGVDAEEPRPTATASPTPEPSEATTEPSAQPSGPVEPSPSDEPTGQPTAEPSAEPTGGPSPSPQPGPTDQGEPAPSESSTAPADDDQQPPVLGVD